MKKEIIKNIKFIAHTPEFRVLLLLAVCAFFILSVDRHNVEAGVGTANAGTLVYGDTANAGTAKFQNLTYSDTFSAEMAGPAASASGIAHVVAKNAPTRDEVITGQTKLDGRLDVHTCTGGCDTAGEMTSSFNKALVPSAIACDASFGACYRGFDIAYESLSGKAMVVFVHGAAGTFNYCSWDGSAWTPASCTTPSTYSLSSGNCGVSLGIPLWVKLIPRGEGLKGTRSNEILAIVAGNDATGIWALIWNGSSWGNCTQLTAAHGTHAKEDFGGAWENTTGNAMVVFANSTTASTTPISYKRWIRSNTTWDSSATTLPAQSASRIGHFVDLAETTLAGKNHIAIMTVSATTVGGTTGSGVPYIWDGSTMTKGNEWGSIEATLSDTSAVAIEALNTNVQALYVSSAAGGADVTGYQTWIEGTGFSAVTDVTGAMGDDAESHKLISSPNRNDIYLLGSDIDDSLFQTRWSGSAWNASFTTRETATLAPGTISGNTHGPEKGSYDMAIRPYSPWQRNWRFYSGTDTASIPTTALANENTTPIDFDNVAGVARLRINYAERSGLGSIDARKKLQYATGCTPNSAGGESGCTWTDVGDPGTGSIWRYKDILCTATDCADNTLLTGTVLTGSGACSLGNGCGTWVMDVDAAAGGNMDHNTLQVQESEWVIETNNAAKNTTYYFRIYDNDQLTPQFREQDADDCGAGSAACTYPSIVTVADPVLDQAAFRFYEDGTESGSTAIDGQSTNILRNVTSDSSLQLRLRIQETNVGIGLTTDDWRLQYSKNSGTYQNIGWAQVGNDLAVASVFSPALAALDSNDVAFFSHGNDLLKTYNFDGTNWAQVGNSFTVTNADAAKLAALNSTDVAFIDAFNDSLRTYRFDGTNWAQVGNGLTISGVDAPALAVLNSTDVAFIDHSNDSLRTYRFDGTDWAQVGNSLSVSSTGVPALTALNSTDVAHINAGSVGLRTYRFDGTNWAQVGNTFAVSGVGTPTLAALNSTKVAFIDSFNDSLRTYRFDGTNWSLLGNNLSVTSGDPALAALNSTDMAFIDTDNDVLRTYRAPGEDVIGFNSSLTDGGATTNRLTGGTGSFVAGKISEDGLVDNHQLTKNNFTEYLYSLTLVSSALANGDTLDFRIIRNDVVISTYSVTPRVTVSNGPTTDDVMRGGSWFNGSGVEQDFYWAR